MLQQSVPGDDVVAGYSDVRNHWCVRTCAVAEIKQHGKDQESMHAIAEGVRSMQPFQHMCNLDKIPRCHKVVGACAAQVVARLICDCA